MTNPPLARLGQWAFGHRRLVIGTWAFFAIGLGIFAPKLEHALSGAMWEVNGSDSLAARQIIDREFGGLSSQSAAVVVYSETLGADDPAFREDALRGVGKSVAHINHLISRLSQLRHELKIQPLPADLNEIATAVLAGLAPGQSVPIAPNLPPVP